MVDAIVIRYGEIFLKKGRRSFFIERLEQNIRHLLREIEPAHIEKPHGRLILRPTGNKSFGSPARILDELQQVFGIESISPAWRLDPTAGPQALMQQCLPLVDEWLNERPIRTFRVSTNRADKRFAMRSLDLNRELGALILASHPELTVRLSEPDLDVGLEIQGRFALLYGIVRPGPGGLPVGASGRVLLLLSGGIDSPVAGHFMQKRGCVLDAVYFHSFPFTGDMAREKVQELATLLARRQRGLRLLVVPFADIQKTCRDQAPGEQLVLLYRRFMLRIAERLARLHGAQALVTGESMGQVASQTLPNMSVINAVATMPVLRPLVGFDKSETTVLARKLGSYDISVRPYDDCCALFVPKHPELHGDPDRLTEIESRLDVTALVERAVAATESQWLCGPADPT